MNRFAENVRGSDLPERAGEQIERVGHYLEDVSVENLGNEIAGTVKKYPVQSMAVGFVAGFLLGRLISR